MPRRGGGGSGSVLAGQRGAACTDQVIPFHVSVSGLTAPPALLAVPPTATQYAAEVQETESRTENLVGLGAASILQDAPFQCTATVVSVMSPALE